MKELIDYIKEEQNFAIKFGANKKVTNDYVDLGLPSKTKWATCNIGAKYPEEFGDYYAWGEIEPKTSYKWDNYIFGRYDAFTKYNETDNLVTLENKDDVASIKTNDKFCIPSVKQCEELLEQTDHEIVKQHNVLGERFISKTNKDKYIFIPFSGYKTAVNREVGETVEFWTNEIKLNTNDYTKDAYTFYVDDSNKPEITNEFRKMGFVIRPVKK